MHPRQHSGAGVSGVWGDVQVWEMRDFSPEAASSGDPCNGTGVLAHHLPRTVALCPCSRTLLCFSPKHLH